MDMIITRYMFKRTRSLSNASLRRRPIISPSLLKKPNLERSTKSIGWRVAELWPFEVFQSGHRPPAWIWSNRKWHRSIRRPRKPNPRTNHDGNRMTRCRAMAIWISDIGDQASKTADRTCKWFYILSNAAMHCIGQTITFVINLKLLTFSWVPD